MPATTHHYTYQSGFLPFVAGAVAAISGVVDWPPSDVGCGRSPLSYPSFSVRALPRPRPHTAPFPTLVCRGLLGVWDGTFTAAVGVTRYVVSSPIAGFVLRDAFTGLVALQVHRSAGSASRGRRGAELCRVPALAISRRSFLFAACPSMPAFCSYNAATGSVRCALRCGRAVWFAFTLPHAFTHTTHHTPIHCTAHRYTYVYLPALCPVTPLCLVLGQRLAGIFGCLVAGLFCSPFVPLYHTTYLPIYIFHHYYCSPHIHVYHIYCPLHFLTSPHPHISPHTHMPPLTSTHTPTPRTPHTHPHTPLPAGARSAGDKRRLYRAIDIAQASVWALPHLTTTLAGTASASAERKPLRYRKAWYARQHPACRALRLASTSRTSGALGAGGIKLSLRKSVLPQTCAS
ncbi:hypothetical protein NPIL_329141 [Nephila pilipes]|uniref:Uncharacterized protein n=1 Tax=Nephila pilipes TaxID=299642 RepID=A0A8X6Q7V1_NEPPI|nr:hypothetical protein NPIL_329141 [Nephila pilipes]